MKRIYGGCLGLLLCLSSLPMAQAQPVKTGAATYFLSPKSGDAPPPAALGRTAALAQQAAPTNQWYSSLLFSPKPEVLYVQPLTAKATPEGFEMALPQKMVVPSERRDVEIHYPHRHPLVIKPTAFPLGQAKLAKVSDWSVDIEQAQGADHLRTTVAHGSPYAFLTVSRGDLRVRLPEGAGAVQAAVATDPRVLKVQTLGTGDIKATTYALFGPTGVRWEQVSPQEWVAHLPPDKLYLSSAALPDASAETLALFTRHAYAFIDNTRVQWRYQADTSQIDTHFKVTTRTMEGPEQGPLLGLYPHHWFNQPELAPRLGPAFDSLRGPIRLLAAPEFQVRSRYPGFVPYWPGLKSPSGAEGQNTSSNELNLLQDLLKTDVRNARRMMLEMGQGAYWQGKGLQRITQLMNVAEQQGQVETRDQLLQLTQKRIESWFNGDSAKTYFHYNAGLGTVVSYPEEYFAVQQMNDHHFHYGYWIRAMADIALRDPKWADVSQWGGMVEMLIADIASAKRGAADFPFLRNFDVYEGHSWASGIGLGEHGNNQESSSEAVNAWSGLILWGEITGNTALRDLGIYLYSSEIQALNHYWFDVHQLVLAPEYRQHNQEVSMLFGGKYAHNTWWTDEPRQIKGINLLPITTSSTYLGEHPAFVQRNLAALPGEMQTYASRGRRANPPDIWQDIFVKYQALAEPAAALKAWDRWGSVELGDTRSHTLHWLLSLQRWGTPDFSVTANTPLYAVFRRPDGQRTHMAYNATNVPQTVRFSDGVSLSVAPRTLATSP